MALKAGKQECVDAIYSECVSAGIRMKHPKEGDKDAKDTETAKMIEIIVDNVIKLFKEHAEVEVVLDTSYHTAMAGPYPVALTHGQTKGKGIK